MNDLDISSLISLISSYSLENLPFPSLEIIDSSLKMREILTAVYQKICTGIFLIAKSRNNQNVHQQENAGTVLNPSIEKYTIVKITYFIYTQY